jgi:hypothetical protein
MVEIRKRKEYKEEKENRHGARYSDGRYGSQMGR